MTVFGDLVLKSYRTFVPKRLQAKLDEDAVNKNHQRFNYNWDGLASMHSVDWMHDPKFANAYQAGVKTGSWGGSPIQWRAYMYVWCASMCAEIEGDFVECGVNKGGFAMTAITYLDITKLNKKFYLMDTYEGVVDALITPEERALGRTGPTIGNYTPCLDEVRDRFAPFPFVVIVPGAIPDTLPQVATDKVSFLSIDMNSVAPERAALEYFWPKVQPGGMILFDDYGMGGHELQKKSHDAFAKANGVFLLTLPTGQGLIMKRR